MISRTGKPYDTYLDQVNLRQGGPFAALRVTARGIVILRCAQDLRLGCLAMPLRAALPVILSVAKDLQPGRLLLCPLRLLSLSS